MIRTKLEHYDLNNVYYNGILHNTSTTPLQASIYDQRDKNIVDVANNYEISIVRFSIPTTLIPILISPSFVNVYSVTLTFGSGGPGSPYQQFVPYTNVSNTNLYPGSVAYYCYQDFLDDVNSALALAFSDLLFANPTCICTQPPSFFYDSFTQRINLFVESTYLDGTINGINIYMNEILFNLFQAYSAEYNTIPAANGKDVRFRILNSNSTAITNVLPRLGYPLYISTLTVPNLIEVQQEFTAISNFTSIRSIIITSGQLPTVAEYLPNIATYDQSSGVSSNNKPIVSDFEIPTLPPQESRTIIEYLPTGEFRMISLTGNQFINKIDFQAYFSDINGVFYPLYLDVNQTFSIKVLFRRKCHKNIH